MTRDQRGEPDLPPGPARDLVDLFRQLRHARPLSGGQIAVKTGLSAGHISDVLRGWKAPSPAAAGKIARALGAGGDAAMAAVRVAEELSELNRHNRKRNRETVPPGKALASCPAGNPATSPEAAPPAARRPRALSSSEICQYRVLGLAGSPDRFLATVTGDLRRVRCADVWVNSENTEMVMARFDEFSVSSIIRYEGARRDDVGRVVDDCIADELERKVARRRPVRPAAAIVTAPGELRRYQVRQVVHVAAVQGEPGAGFHQVRDVGRCVTSVMAAVDSIATQPPLRTILFPLLGVGQGGGELYPTVSSLTGAVIDYFTSTPTRIATVFFLAYSDAELSACEACLAGHQRLALAAD